MTKGDRFNAGKLKWSLVDFKSFHPMVRVLEFGARKYTKVLVPLLEQNLEEWNAKVVKETGRYEQEDSVIHVMKQNYSIQIQIKRGEDPSTLSSIGKRIEKGLLNLIGNEISIEDQIKNISARDEILIIEDGTVSVAKSSITSRKRVAYYVRTKMEPCTLITTTQLENSEVSFAVSAITALDSLTTMLNFLNGVLNTSHQAETFVETGAHNWKKGLPTTEVCESMLRHIHAYLDGEDLDPESGLPHVGHIQCNAMFLSRMTETEHDNRPDRKHVINFKGKITNNRDNSYGFTGEQ